MSTDAPRLPAAATFAGTPVLPKAADLVAMQLRRRIVRGELTAGVTLPPESSLLEHFKVSRPTLREAFRVLESEQLIEVRRGSGGGTRVRAPDGDVAARYSALVLEYRGVTLTDVFEAAAVLEAPLAGLLATRRTAADLERLRAAVDLEEAAGDDLRLAAERSALVHRLVLDLAGNETLGILVQLVRRIVDTASLRGQAREGRSDRQARAAHAGARTHRRLVDLVAARDAAGAEDLWRCHALESGRFLSRSLESAAVLDLLD